MKFENKAASVEVLLVMFLDEPVFFTSMLYLKELKVGLSLPPKIWTSLERHSQLYQIFTLTNPALIVLCLTCVVFLSQISEKSRTRPMDLATRLFTILLTICDPWPDITSQSWPETKTVIQRRPEIRLMYILWVS